jgi:hypothetical protein
MLPEIASTVETATARMLFCLKQKSSVGIAHERDSLCVSGEDYYEIA